MPLDSMTWPVTSFDSGEANQVTIKARNDLGAKTGDTVRVMETRPLAKTVRWRVTEIVEKAK